MPPAWLALYAFFAERKKICGNDSDCRDCRDCFVEVSQVTGSLGEQEINRIYWEIPGSRRTAEMSTSGIHGLTVENFYSYRSKINRKLQKTYGHSHIGELEIASSGNKPDTCYGLRLDKSRVFID